MIGCLIVLLLVPIANVESLVGERVQHAADAPRCAWRHPGAARRPPPACCWRFRSKPRTWWSNRPPRDAKPQRTEIQRNVLYVLPDTLNVNASAEPDYRNVGLYRTPVYLANVPIDGEFLNRDFAHLLQPKAGARSEVGRGAAAGAQLRIAGAARRR